jgi:hypothetical protein
MAQADSVLSTPPTNTPITQTRRGFLGRTAAALAAGTAVNVTAIAATRPASAAHAVALDGTKASQELKNLVDVLHTADEASNATQAAFDAEYDLYRAWVKKNPEPRTENRRAWRKWDGRQKQYLRSSNFGATQDAHQESVEAFAVAKMAIAKYRPRDMNELVLKACLVIVYEAGSRRGYSRPVMARGVALDVARLGKVGLAS